MTSSSIVLRLTSSSVRSTMDQDRVEPGEFDYEDPNLEEKLVNVLKNQGIFDQFRKDCLSDVDTKVIEHMSSRIFVLNTCLKNFFVDQWKMRLVAILICNHDEIASEEQSNC